MDHKKLTPQERSTNDQGVIIGRERGVTIGRDLTPSMAAAMIHPGLYAKSEMQNLLLTQNVSRADSNRAGNRSYCDAMRSFQDDYAVRVGIPCGQSRVGPKRMRWTRAEWHARQSDVKSLAEKEKRLREREQLLKEREKLPEQKGKNVENDEERFNAKPNRERLRCIKSTKLSESS